MTNITELRHDFNKAQELIYEILNDSEHAVLNQKHPMHTEASIAFQKLELYVQNLIDQIAKLQRKSA